MRRELLALVAATTSLVLVAFLIPLGLLLRSDAEDRVVAAATLETQSLATIVGTGAVGADQVTTTLDQLNSSSDRKITVFMPDGAVLGVAAPRSHAVELAARGMSFSTDLPNGGGRAVLVPVQGLPGGTAVVQTVVPSTALHRGVTTAWLIIAGLGVALLGVAVLLAAQLGRRLMRSVGRLAAVSDALAAGQLDARVIPDGPPEVRKVGAGLNRLAMRIGELLTAEREEVADLSHRLRTPVTALRLDADSLRDPEEAARLASDVDALERMVDEVIRAARRPVREGVRAYGDLVAVVRDRARFWSVLAEDQGRELRADLPDLPVPVRASAEDIVAAVDALFGNVFAHTPDGVGMRVHVEARPGGGGRLTMEDEGPGFPDPGVLERGRSGGGSTGLGLDIVRRTAEASGGTMVLGASATGGAQVVIEFGPPV